MSRALVMVMVMVVGALACGPGLADQRGVPVVPPLPGQGGPRWAELVSPHATLWTDATPDRAHELIGEIERLHQVLTGTLLRGTSRSAHVFVIAVRDSNEHAAYMAGHGIGWDAEPHETALHQAFMVFAAHDWFGSEERSLAHELAHAISYSWIRRQPRWFAEGLGNYAETIGINEWRGTVAIGKLAVRPDVELMPLRALLRCDRACRGNQFYNTATLLFAYLSTSRPDRLMSFMEQMAGGQPWEQAFAEAFGVAPDAPDALERELRTWVVAGRHPISHFNVRFDRFTVRERTLGDADVLAARALLASIASVPRDQVRAGIDAALRLDPTSVLANALLVSDGAIVPERARAVAAAHPEDWRAWWVAGAVLAGDEALAARTRACELAGGNPAVELPAEWCAASAAAQR